MRLFEYRGIQEEVGVISNAQFSIG